MEEEAPSSSSCMAELLPRPLTSNRSRLGSSTGTCSLGAKLKSPASSTLAPAPLAQWEQEELRSGEHKLPGCILPRPLQVNSRARVESSDLDEAGPSRAAGEPPSLLPTQGRQRPRTSEQGMRRVSWDDHRMNLFASNKGDGSDERQDDRKMACCGLLSREKSPPKSSRAETPENVEMLLPRNLERGEDRQQSPCWQWRSSSEPDEMMLANLFTSSCSSPEELDDDECAVSVSSSSGGWKGDYSSHFKGASSSSSSPSLNRAMRAPIPPTSRSPTKSMGLSHTPTSPVHETCCTRGPPYVRSATPTPRSTKKDSPVRARKCITPDVTHTGKSLAEDVCMEHRFMECSCCGRKSKDHLEIQLGVERELQVENQPTKRKVNVKVLTRPTKKKPPMRFGLGPGKPEFLNKAAAMNNASSKARFTVLPVVTLSKAQKQQAVRPGTKPLKSRVNTEFKGGWDRGCSSVLPRPQSSFSQQKQKCPATPDMDLATPSLNSTATLLERLQETKQEKFDPRTVLQRDDMLFTKSHHHHHHHHQHRHPQQQVSDGELAQRYKDLCKITDVPSPSDQRRVLRKQRTELMVALRRNKPEISDLWIPSEQCPQVCSTATIRIEPAEWPNVDDTRRENTETEREALCRGARNAMSLYGLPNLF